MRPKLESRTSIMFAPSRGSKKLGQPQPDSNLVSDLNLLLLFSVLTY